MWLDLANAYGSVSHQLMEDVGDSSCAASHSSNYSDLFWRVHDEVPHQDVHNEVGPSGGRYCDGVRDNPSLFVLTMQLLLNAVGSNVPEAHLGKGLYMPSLKTTLVMNTRRAVQNTQDTFNSLLGWCQMAFKPAKSRSLALVRGKFCSDVSFVVAGQQVPTVSEEPVKSLGCVFNDSLTDKN